MACVYALALLGMILSNKKQEKIERKKKRGGKKERKEKKWSENLNKIDNDGLSKAKTEIYTFSLNNSVTILGEELLLPKFE